MSTDCGNQDRTQKCRREQVWRRWQVGCMLILSNGFSWAQSFLCLYAVGCQSLSLSEIAVERCIIFLCQNCHRLHYKSRIFVENCGRLFALNLACNNGCNAAVSLIKRLYSGYGRVDEIWDKNTKRAWKLRQGNIDTQTPYAIEESVVLIPETP